MIAVIADDFTGAAEICGLGLRRGLRVHLETEVSGTTDADLLVVATNTRSMNAVDARQEAEQVTRKLLELSPDYIYKKLDSVLRGHVYAELLSQMQVCGKKRALVVPANPHFNRIIRNGVYYVDGLPLAKTYFASDPEFPVRYSEVKAILGKGQQEIHSLGNRDKLPDRGIILGDVCTDEDLQFWADRADRETLLAGGSGFFEVVLGRDFPGLPQRAEPGMLHGKNALFIFGSTFPKDAVTMGNFREAGVNVLNLPGSLFREKSVSAEIDRWSGKIAGEINLRGELALSTAFPASAERIPAFTIRKIMGELIGEVMQRVRVNNLFIEGGATASQILAVLEIRQLVPFLEVDSGVIQMHVPDREGLCITTKPGSYRWPELIRK
ncbi:MAG: four-carbon acid sugar kinase family protein [Mangrovibacterium sp.]